MSHRSPKREATRVSKRRVIVGPILRDLAGLGWDGEHAVLATAFYSRRALQSLAVASKELQVLCRLDPDEPREWARGMIAPDALLERLRFFEKEGTAVELRIHRSAHAKVYLGEYGVMIGSANLTLQGFGGAWEMVQTSSTQVDIRKMRTELKAYARTLEAFTLDDLEAYVAKYRSLVLQYARRRRGGRHREQVPAPTARPPRLGHYNDFLIWVKRQRRQAAREIHARASGKGNLQGHINRNFFGLRQFLLAYPEHIERFSTENPDAYKLSKDPMMERDLKNFVEKHATDEDSFSLNIWMTYLPRECGGRAAKHGGTIGNLNRMLPLIARYLVSTTQ